MHSSNLERSDEAHVGFGIDIGGSGIKGARVDLRTGEFIGERIKIATPQPATPTAVADTVATIINQAHWAGPVGITVPSVVRNQQALTAANIDPEWIDCDLSDVFSTAVGGRECAVLNDADAAGLAEVAFGDPHAQQGVVILATLGTGIGSALLTDGTLVPNTELGHLMIQRPRRSGKITLVEAEAYAASSVRQREELSYKKWAKRLSHVLSEYERLFWPDLFILGGGVSRKFDKWGPLLEVDTQVVPARLRNRAGIVGAAMAVNRGIRP